MSDGTPTHACPDCGAPLEPITLFARGAENPISGYAEDATLCYSGPGARRSALWSMFERQGTVTALMCTGCRRILLFGVPADSGESIDESGIS